MLGFQSLLCTLNRAIARNKSYGILDPGINFGAVVVEALARALISGVNCTSTDSPRAFCNSRLAAFAMAWATWPGSTLPAWASLAYLASGFNPMAACNSAGVSTGARTSALRAPQGSLLITGSFSRV